MHSHTRQDSTSSSTSSTDSFQDALSALDGASLTAPRVKVAVPPAASAPKRALAPPPQMTQTEDDDDAPPAFPALNSAQRSVGSSFAAPAYRAAAAAGASSRSAATNSSLRSVLGVPPATSSRPANNNNNHNGDTAPNFFLALPPRTTAATAPPGVGGAGGALAGLSAARLGTPPSAHSAGGGLTVGGLGVSPTLGGGRKKVALAPGCSALDWAKEKASGKPELRAGLTSYQRITPSELAKHKAPEDAWSAFNGKVYNLTPYLRFHPGGEKELLRVAGRDGTRLFMLTHSWVNIDAMIDTTMVGMLVSE